MKPFKLRLLPLFALAGAISIGLRPVMAQEQIDPTVGTVGTVANDGPLPAGGVSLLGLPITALTLSGKAADQAEIGIVPVAGQSFNQAVRVKIKSKTRDTDILLDGPPFGAVKGGDTIFIRLWGRAIETGDPKGEASVQVSVHSASDPNTIGFFGGTATFGKEWRRFDLPIPEYSRFDNGQFSLRLGGEARTLELAALEVYNYGNQVMPHQLPFKRVSYQGREPDAPWRREAAAGIEKYRKGDLKIEVVNAAGKPVKGAAVKVEMQRHAYGFGSIVSRRLFDTSAEGDRYRAQAGQLFDGKIFNVGIVENDLKPRANEIGPGKSGLAQLRWLRERGIETKIGGPLTYPSWRNSPDSYRKLYEDTKAAQGEEAAKAALGQAVTDHISRMVTQVGELCSDWEVVNETIANHDLQDILGPDAIVGWFKTARAANPQAVLSINENSVESGKKLPAYSQQIQFLLDHGAPLGAIGLQGHVGALPIARVRESLDLMAKFGLPLKITEFDMVTPDEKLQADYTRDFLTLCFAHPATTEFMMWGFADQDHWLGDAPMFYRDGTLKPSGQAFIDLVTKTWWTSASGASDAKGNYQTRGFLGDYLVTVSRGGKTQTVPAKLGRDGQTVRVQLR